MKIDYKSDKQKAQLENFKYLSKTYGILIARQIIKRIQELDAAFCLKEMPPQAGTHPLKGNLKGYFSIDINGSALSILIEPQDEFDITNYSTNELPRSRAARYPSHAKPSNILS